MISSRKAEMQAAKPMPATLRPRKRAATRPYRVLSWLFSGQAATEAIETRAHVDAGPEAVWNRIMFYEEVPGRPPFLLRALLPRPVRTEGSKTDAGAIIQCSYRQGELVKRITFVSPPHLVQFEVIEQRLGIEGCAMTLGGSYQIRRCGDGTDVVLTTNYRAYLRPRHLWRPLEALLVGQLHNHILGGVRAAIPPANRGVRPVIGESLTPQCVSHGGLVCTASQLRSHR
jgi:hypothetical protein